MKVEKNQKFITEYETNKFVVVEKYIFYFYEIVNLYGINFKLIKTITDYNSDILFLDNNFEPNLYSIFDQKIITYFNYQD